MHTPNSRKPLNTGLYSSPIQDENSKLNNESLHNITLPKLSNGTNIDNTIIQKENYTKLKDSTLNNPQNSGFVLESMQQTIDELDKDQNSNDFSTNTAILQRTLRSRNAKKINYYEPIIDHDILNSPRIKRAKTTKRKSSAKKKVSEIDAFDTETADYYSVLKTSPAKSPRKVATPSKSIKKQLTKKTAQYVPHDTTPTVDKCDEQVLIQSDHQVPERKEADIWENFDQTTVETNNGSYFSVVNDDNDGTNKETPIANIQGNVDSDENGYDTNVAGTNTELSKEFKTVGSQSVDTPHPLIPTLNEQNSQPDNKISPTIGPIDNQTTVIDLSATSQPSSPLKLVSPNSQSESRSESLHNVPSIIEVTGCNTLSISAISQGTVNTKEIYQKNYNQGSDVPDDIPKDSENNNADPKNTDEQNLLITKANTSLKKSSGFEEPMTVDTKDDVPKVLDPDNNVSDQYPKHIENRNVQNDDRTGSNTIDLTCIDQDGVLGLHVEEKSNSDLDTVSDSLSGSKYKTMSSLESAEQEVPVPVDGQEDDVDTYSKDSSLPLATDALGLQVGSDTKETELENDTSREPKIEVSSSPVSGNPVDKASDIDKIQNDNEEDVIFQADENSDKSELAKEVVLVQQEILLHTKETNESQPEPQDQTVSHNLDRHQDNTLEESIEIQNYVTDKEGNVDIHEDVFDDVEHTSHSPVIENTEKFETNDRDLNVVDTNETEDINNEVSLHKDYNDSNSDISQDKDLVQSTNLHSEPVTGATADFDIPSRTQSIEHSDIVESGSELEGIPDRIEIDHELNPVEPSTENQTPKFAKQKLENHLDTGLPEKASEAADSESNVLEKHIDSNTSQDNQVPISLDETQESDYNHEAIGSISKQDSDSENHSPFPKQNDGADDVNPKYQNNHNYSKEQTYSTLSSQITIKTQVQSSFESPDQPKTETPAPRIEDESFDFSHTEQTENVDSHQIVDEPEFIEEVYKPSETAAVTKPQEEKPGYVSVEDDELRDTQPSSLHSVEEENPTVFPIDKVFQSELSQEWAQSPNSQHKDNQVLESKANTYTGSRLASPVPTPSAKNQKHSDQTPGLYSDVDANELLRDDEQILSNANFGHLPITGRDRSETELAHGVRTMAPELEPDSEPCQYINVPPGHYFPFNEKPFRGMLSGRNADTSRTLPTTRDIRIFNKTLKLQQEKLNKGGDVDSKPTTATDLSFKVTPSIACVAHSTRTCKIKYVVFDNSVITPVYPSLYPEEYNWYDTIYICQYCFKYTCSERAFQHHSEKCGVCTIPTVFPGSKHQLPLKRGFGEPELSFNDESNRLAQPSFSLQKCKPPGKEIYRNGPYSIYEVDGETQKLYCTNLSLFAKLFIKGKTRILSISSFLFYVLTVRHTVVCVVDDKNETRVYNSNKVNGNRFQYLYEDEHFVGYFSKEKISETCSQTPHNLTCILISPVQHGKGFGSMLIEFSYLLSRMENIAATPENPLSDEARSVYQQYWDVSTCYALRHVYSEINRNSGPKNEELLDSKDVAKSQRYPQKKSSSANANSLESHLLSVPALSKLTGMLPHDIVASLKRLGFLLYIPNANNNSLEGGHKFKLAVSLKKVEAVIQGYEEKHGNLKQYNADFGTSTFTPKILLPNRETDRLDSAKKPKHPRRIDASKLIRLPYCRNHSKYVQSDVPIKEEAATECTNDNNPGNTEVESDFGQKSSPTPFVPKPSFKKGKSVTQGRANLITKTGDRNVTGSQSKLSKNQQPSAIGANSIKGDDDDTDIIYISGNNGYSPNNLSSGHAKQNSIISVDDNSDIEDNIVKPSKANSSSSPGSVKEKTSTLPDVVKKGKRRMTAANLSAKRLEGKNNGLEPRKEPSVYKNDGYGAEKKTHMKDNGTVGSWLNKSATLAEDRLEDQSINIYNTPLHGLEAKKHNSPSSTKSHYSPTTLRLSDSVSSLSKSGNGSASVPSRLAEPALKNANTAKYQPAQVPSKLTTKKVVRDKKDVIEDPFLYSATVELEHSNYYDVNSENESHNDGEEEFVKLLKNEKGNFEGSKFGSNGQHNLEKKMKPQTTPVSSLLPLSQTSLMTTPKTLKKRKPRPDNYEVAHETDVGVEYPVQQSGPKRKRKNSNTDGDNKRNLRRGSAGFLSNSDQPDDWNSSNPMPIVYSSRVLRSQTNNKEYEEAVIPVDI